MLTSNQLKVACDGCDCDDELRDTLEEMLWQARQDRNRKQALRIRRVLRKGKLFNQLESKCKAKFVASGVSVANGGEIIKYLVEWFTENWEVIIEFIKAIVAIF